MFFLPGVCLLVLWALAITFLGLISLDELHIYLTSFWIFFLKLSKFGLNRYVDGEVQVKVIVTGLYFNKFFLNTWDLKISFQYHVVNEPI